jgi:hypothetical protein
LSKISSVQIIRAGEGDVYVRESGGFDSGSFVEAFQLRIGAKIQGRS